MSLSVIRSLFPHTSQGKIYLNHAGTSPLSTRVVGAMTRYLQERSTGKLETYWDDVPMVGEVRQLIQRMINAESTERIALTANTSDAICIIAAGIPWRSGDRILMNSIEFPANVWPYLNLKDKGVEIDVIQSDDGRIALEQISDHLTPRTRLLALSAVQYLSGYRADLSSIGALCRQKGIIFAVDGIQAVGAVKIDVSAMKIDALAAGGQKWQMSPHGTGFLYLTEELQDQIQQVYLGWLAVQDPWQFNNHAQPVAASARRYEGGSLTMPCLWGMHAALSTMLEFGMENIERSILALSRTLINGLSGVDGVELVTPPTDDEHAGIVTIKLPRNDGKDVMRKLQERNITAALREGLIRFSPHFYMTEDEMRAVVEATKECVKQA